MIIIIEAICSLTRQELGSIVFMWSGHERCAPNSMADSVAKAQINRESDTRQEVSLRTVLGWSLGERSA